jgi:hypothetical protein
LKVGSSFLSETVGAVAEEFEKAEVGKDLELLANFETDVAIGGMQSGEFWFKWNRPL